MFCSGYEDVAWDTKLPRRLKPPATTREKMADQVDQHFTIRRYHTRPELWQVQLSIMVLDYHFVDKSWRLDLMA